MKTLPILLLCLMPFASQHTDTEPAVAFLQSLNEAQRQKAQLSFEDLSREKWHFLPAASWARTGIPLFELSTRQKELLFTLLHHNLSQAGYDKVLQIISLENVLAEMTHDPEYRDPEKYYVAFYGQPDADSLWAWSFEGHHISLNFSIVDHQIAMTPRFFGANPATVPDGSRKGERTLAREEDLGFALINALTPAQKEVAIFREQSYREIVTSNASEVSPLETVGIALQDLGPKQQRILLDLIEQYLSAMPDALAAQRREKLRQEDQESIRFGWVGATAPGKAHYYRVQGKSFLIEFDNSQNNANHIHTVWRDFDGDFGRDLIKEHYQHDHHK